VRPINRPVRSGGRILLVGFVALVSRVGNLSLLEGEWAARFDTTGSVPASEQQRNFGIQQDWSIPRLETAIMGFRR
jgi:hypothetical protein